MYSFARESLPFVSAWPAFVRGAKVFGAMIPGNLPESLPDRDAPHSAILTAVYSAVVAAGADNEGPRPLEKIHIDFNDSGMRLRFGGGRTYIELWVSALGACILTIGSTVNSPDVLESIRARWDAAIPGWEDDHARRLDAMTFNTPA